jgi:hypothetical protein
MKKYLVMFFTGVMVLFLSGVAMAETDTASSVVTITFSEVAELGVSGDPGTMTIDNPASAGNLPADATESTTTMSWTSNVPAAQTRKITGNLDVLFSGILLYANVSAPGTDGGTSAGKTQFVAAATDYDFVTAIGNCNASAQSVTFTAEVSEMVAPYTSTAHTITWTFTAAAI